MIQAVVAANGVQSRLFLEGVKPFELEPARKEAFLREELAHLRRHHREHCADYARLLNYWPGQGDSLDAYPYFPVTLFKEYELVSAAGDLTVIESSATTSANASKIFVDKASRKRQSKSANMILSDFIGNDRRPYLVFDLESTVRGSKGFSARGAAILSLAHLASKFYFVMKETEQGLALDQEALAAALDQIGSRPFIAYGFTFILYQAHLEMPQGLAADPSSVLLHSGGWKKLVDLAVDKQTFNRTVAGPWGLQAARVIDFYGTVEQVGMAYPDCAAGYKHVPYWAEVLIRRADTLEVASVGETGLIQLVSCLPLAAPNHSVLTEDLGRVVLEDGCACGRRGRAFEFQGRAPKSELRGCSDVVRR